MNITIKTEDKPSPEFGCVIPCELKLWDDELTITCLDETKAAVEEFINKYADDPFSKEALDWLFDEMGKYGQANDLHYDSLPEDLLYLNYAIESEDEIDKSLILRSTKRVNRRLLKENYENLTEFDFENNIEEGLESFVTVADRKIVSAACDNFGGELAEAAVETSPDARRKGYAASNTAALALETVKDDRMLSYVCGAENKASIMLAEKVGFKLRGKSFFCVLYDSEDWDS